MLLHGVTDTEFEIIYCDNLTNERHTLKEIKSRRFTTRPLLP